MRPALPVLALLVALAALAAWRIFASDHIAPPPAAGGSLDGRTPPAAEPAPSQRSDGAPNRPVRPADAAAATPPPTATPRQEAAPTNVLLRVHDVATQRPVAEFTWRYRSDGPLAKGSGTAGEANLRLAPGTAGQLMIEAEGRSPFVRELVVPAGTEPPMTVDAFLAPAAIATGITLLVHDLALQPIPHIRVDAFALQPESRGTTGWALGAPLWSRRTSAADGRYPLPELPPGEYGIRVGAVTEDGTLLPMLPFTRQFELTGSNGFVEDVALESGCLPVLELVDATGNLLDPALVGTVTLDLRLVGGPAASRRWTVTNGSVSASAIDVLPGKGPATAAEALPAGSYELQVAIAGRTPVQSTLLLRPGDVLVERIVVP